MKAHGLSQDISSDVTLEHFCIDNDICVKNGKVHKLKTLNVNQGIAIAALIAGILTVFFAPRFYYDYKISECAKSQVKVSPGERSSQLQDTAELLCHHYINGSR
jgi:hypothetical protein